MRITCSILCYNYGRYLAQAIESCLNQEPGNYELEVLVIDDGSTDETPIVCQLYKDRIRVLRSSNQGFGASLGKAICEASGDYVCLLDGDDYFATKKILSLLPMIHAGYLYIEHKKYCVNEESQLIDYSTHGGGNTSTLCVNRIAALSLLPAHNELFFHPLKSAGYGVELDEPLSFYRLHSFSMIRSRSLNVWYSHLAEVTHTLANQLLFYVKKTTKLGEFTYVKKISSKYLAIAYYDEMEAALQINQRGKALLACIGILLATVRSQTGLTTWHCKVIIRGLLGQPLRENHLSKD